MLAFFSNTKTINLKKNLVRGKTWKTNKQTQTEVPSPLQKKNSHTLKVEFYT